MASISKLACIYPNLILHREEDKNNVIIKTSGVNFGPFGPALFAKAQADVNFRSLFSNVGAGRPTPAGEPVPTTTTAAPAEKKGVEAKKEESEESDNHMGFGLFN